MRRGSALLFALVALAGCGEPELGMCVPSEARRVVYDELGSPAFEGQALMIASCGNGSFCHSDAREPRERYGVPVGLEYDLRLAGYDGFVDEAEVTRLTRMHDNAYAQRRAIWRQVASGAMPPAGAAGDAVADSAPHYYRRPPEERVPGLDTAEGREVLRNWLACGLPLVERTALVEDSTYEPVGHAVPAFEVEPLRAEWPDIYARLIAPRCNGAACHGAAGAAELDLRGEGEARERMLAGTATGDECRDTRLGLLVPGEPNQSLFYLKLAGQSSLGQGVCGRIMPPGGARLSDASLAAIYGWIEGGAAATP